METIAITNYNYIENKKAKEPLLWIGLVSIIMFFAGLTSAVIVSSTNAAWKIVELPNAFWISSVIIILSSITYQIGFYLVQKNQLKLPKMLFISTLMLGFLFVYFQFEGLSDLYQQGIYATGNQSTNSSSYIYVLTGLHVLHLFIGMISLGVVSAKSVLNKYDCNNNMGIKLSLTYWHFLGILWLYLFMFLSIMMSK